MRFRAPNAAVLQVFQQLFDADQVRQAGGSTGPYVFHSRSKNILTLLSLCSGRIEAFYCEPDYELHTTLVPNDPNFPQLWGLRNINGADISAVPAWDISTGSTTNVVGVIDTGIDYNHPDLVANVWSAPTAFTVNLSSGPLTCPAGSHGYNAVLHTCNPLDDHGHGTHVSGTIGALGNNSTGVVGVNWNTKIIAMKFLDSTGNGTTSDAIDSIEFAIQVKAAFAGTSTPVNVRVLSNSWGGAGFSNALLDEINKANTNDILFVAAAGNADTNNDVAPFYPASFNAPNVIAVAATDVNDLVASFSNYGKNSVHLGAPGVAIYSTYLSASYAYLSGTSMATPHVSGAAMLVLSACSLNTAALKTTLLANVDPNASLASITVTGGRLNVNKAIRSCVAQPGNATSIWSSSVVPAIPWIADFSPATLGLKFRSDTAGSITGIRFYKGAGNNGTHIGVLYSSTGTLLAQATFSGETTSGWQQVSFSSPVAIAANTTYIAAFWTSTGYAADRFFFTSAGVDNPPLHALRSGVDGLNGVYAYGSTPQFPVNGYVDSNFWVDVVFTAGSVAQAAAPVFSPAPGTYTGTQQVTITSSTPGANIRYTTDGSAPTATSGTLYAGPLTVAITTTIKAIAYASNMLDSSVSTATYTITQGTGSFSIWSSSAVPAIPWIADLSPATLGLKFRSDAAGSITGIRFYKGAGNNGTHMGLLYSSTGTLLAQATFSGETTSGWQQVSFSSPVAIAANTTYIAAFWTSTGYAADRFFFTSAGVDNAPLHALRSGVDGLNGVYAYGSAPQFPVNSYVDSNFWVDVVFTAGSVAQAAAPVFSPAQGAYTGTQQVAITSSTTGANIRYTTDGSAPTATSGTLYAGPLAVSTTTTIKAIAYASSMLDSSVSTAAYTITPATGSLSIWSSSAVPAVPWIADLSPATLGLKFRSDAGGSITGIRFYKGAGNNGTHMGLLYSSTGTLLAQANFSGETTSGWQQVSFSSPVAIAANTTYIAAFWTSSGYAVDRPFFTSAGVDHAPLHALRSGVDGPNGMYGYGSTPQFPLNSYADSNYWVDVVFTTP